MKPRQHEKQFDLTSHYANYNIQPPKINTQSPVSNQSGLNPDRFQNPVKFDLVAGIDMDRTSLHLIFNNPGSKDTAKMCEQASDYVFDLSSASNQIRVKAHNLVGDLFDDKVSAVSTLMLEEELLAVLRPDEFVGLLLYKKLNNCLFKLRDISVTEPADDLKLNLTTLRMSILKASIAFQEYIKLMYEDSNASKYRSEVMKDLEGGEFVDLVNWAVSSGHLEKIIEFIFIETDMFPKMMEIFETKAEEFNKIPFNQDQRILFGLFKTVFNSKPIDNTHSILKTPPTYESFLKAASSNYRNDPRRFIFYAYICCKADVSTISELLSDSILSYADKKLIEKHWEKIASSFAKT